MLIRPLQAAFMTAALLVLASMRAGAQEPMSQMMTSRATSENQESMPGTAAEHQAVAERLQKEAEQYGKLATEHERMVAEYRKRARAQPKANYTALADHCERLARDLNASAREAREMARLHEDVARMIAK